MEKENIMEKIMSEIGSELDKYWFESELEKVAHDCIRDQYIQHAQAINHVIKPWIVNSVKKERWTKGQGRDEYHIPCLHVRVTNDIEDVKGLPYHVMEAQIVNPKTGVGFIADMPIGNPEKVTSLDFCIFAEHINSALIQYLADKQKTAKEGIIING
jgi:hypothetical protein